MPMAGMSLEVVQTSCIFVTEAATSVTTAIIQETPPVCQAVRQAGVSIFCAFSIIKKYKKLSFYIQVDKVQH